MTGCAVRLPHLIDPIVLIQTLSRYTMKFQAEKSGLSYLVLPL